MLKQVKCPICKTVQKVAERDKLYNCASCSRKVRALEFIEKQKPEQEEKLEELPKEEIVAEEGLPEQKEPEKFPKKKKKKGNK